MSSNQVRIRLPKLKGNFQGLVKKPTVTFLKKNFIGAGVLVFA